MNVDTVITGDCLEVMKELADESIDLIVADPPYNVSRDGGRNGYKGKKFVKEDWDNIGDYHSFSVAWMAEARRVLKSAGTMYVWGYHRSFPLMPIADWYAINMIVWHKRNAFPNTMQNVAWSPSCEYAYFLRKKPGKDHTFHIGKDDFARDFFDLPTVTNARHPCEKPLGIIREFVRRSTNPGDLVLDPFLGSGTTAEACRALGRRYIGIESDARMADIARDRIAQSALQMTMAI